MDKLRKCVQEQVSIGESAMNSILDAFETVDLEKGAFFVRSGTICREMAFIESGYLRMYDLAQGKEITLWIGGEGRFITSLSSFVFQTSNHWNIQAITDCRLRVISRERHFELTRSEPKWLEFDNVLLAHSFALLERRMFDQLHTTSKQRFHQLLAECPEVFHHVPLKYIASMLGIEPESLSRLRKNETRSIT